MLGPVTFSQCNFPDFWKEKQLKRSYYIEKHSFHEIPVSLIGLIGGLDKVAGRAFERALDYNYCKTPIGTIHTFTK